MNRFRFLVSIAILVLLPVFMYAQTVFSNCTDGKIYFKYKDNLAHKVEVNSDNSVDLNRMPFLQPLVEPYGIQQLSRPFFLNNDPKLLRTYMLEFNQFSKVEALIHDLMQNPDLEYAEKVPFDIIDHTPNDTLYTMYNGANNWKWHLDRIQAEQAWDLNKGSASIKVAIVDNAVWAQHPDLASKIVLQRDVSNNTNSSSPPTTGDPFEWSHGTHCAGLAAAATNNSTGVASIGYNVSLIAVKAASNSAPDNIAYGYQGMQWAANNGAKVISCSWGNTQYSSTNQNLINSIHNMGIVMLASAGNDNVNTNHYPSGYNWVISVASTNSDDAKSDFSNYGTTIDICSPGGYNATGPSGLLSTTFSDGTYGKYDIMAGTSMACPLAAGLAGLVLSVNPNLNPQQLETLLKNTCDDITAQNPNYTGQLGAGRINAFKAIASTPFPPTADFSTPVTIITPGTSINFTDLSVGVPSQWQWTFDNGYPATSTAQNPAGVLYNATGTFSVTLKVTNDFGNNTVTKTNYITVTNTPLPYIRFAADNLNPCIKQTVHFTDSTLYNPVTWEWSFSPGTAQFVNGTSANSQNPDVQFLQPGVYAVTLTCTNANGIKSTTVPGMISVSGSVQNYTVTMEDGTAGMFILKKASKSQIAVDSRAANQSSFGIHFHGDPSPTTWVGGANSTTATQAWNQNVNYQSEAYLCGIDATGMTRTLLTLDLKQTYSLGKKFSWFRVLINGVPVADTDGVTDFNPATTNADPFRKITFDISQFSGGVFDVKLQAACRFAYGSSAGADNVFVDNIDISSINNTAVGDKLLSGFSVNIAPNPSEGLYLVSVYNLSEQAVLSVRNLQGALVYSATLEPGVSTKSIDLTGMSSGVYQLQVKTSRQQVNKLLIKN